MPIERPNTNYYNPMESPKLFNSKSPSVYKGGGVPSALGAPVEFDVNTHSGVLNDLDTIAETPRTDDHYENLVPLLDERLTKKIGDQCKSWLDKDLESRSEWEETIRKGIESLGTNILELDEPFEGACSAVHPLILEAAVKFQSKATAELLPATGPVKTQIMGTQSEDKMQRATRVKNFMNYQTTRLMPEYYPDMERLLYYLPLYGSAFKKTWWDAELGRPVSCFITADNFVVNSNAKSLIKARRYSEILPSISGAELRRKINDGEYIEPKEWRMNNSNSPNYNSIETFDVTGDSGVGGSGSVYETRVTQAANSAVGFQVLQEQNNKVFTLIEQHCYLSLPEPFGDIGFTDPYIVTFIQDTGEVLAIRRNWKENDINKRKRLWYSDYHYVPGFGFYGMGLFHLLGNFQVTLTAIIRSLVDSGQFANLQGGLKLKGMRIVGDSQAIAPGQWKDVEGAINDISKSLFPIPYKEPSQTLFAMLQWLDGRAGAFADSTEQIVADSTNYGPVGTTVALLEASMKLFSAIHKRTHFAQEKDLKLLADINFEYMPNEYPYDVPGEARNVFKDDFNPDLVDVIPVSDPNVTSNSHRLAMAQTMLQAALQSPNIHNLKQAYREFYLALGREDVDRLVPPDQEAQPLSPLEDVIALSQGKPIKAFPGQDHKAHVEFKMTWMQDPLVGGASETLKQLVPNVMANIREHQILQLQEQINGLTQQQGIPNNDPNVLAQVQAQAAAQVKKANEALAQMMGGENPMQMIAQAEMLKAQTEAKRVAHVKVKDLADLSIKAQKLDIDRINAVLKGKDLGANVQLKQFSEGVKAVQLGLDNLMKEAERTSREDLEYKKIEAMKNRATAPKK